MMRLGISTLICGTQVGFFELVIIPLYEGLTYAFEDVNVMLNAAKDNHRLWVQGNQSVIAQQVAQLRASIPPTTHWSP